MPKNSVFGRQGLAHGKDADSGDAHKCALQATKNHPGRASKTERQETSALPRACAQCMARVYFFWCVPAHMLDIRGNEPVLIMIGYVDDNSPC